jgi:hypothetical protein
LRIAGSALVGAATSDDARLYRPGGECLTQVLGVVAAVGQQGVGSVPAPAAERRDAIDERQQVAALVLVGAAQRDA